MSEENTVDECPIWTKHMGEYDRLTEKLRDLEERKRNEYDMDKRMELLHQIGRVSEERHEVRLKGIELYYAEKYPDGGPRLTSEEEARFDELANACDNLIAKAEAISAQEDNESDPEKKKELFRQWCENAHRVNEAIALLFRFPETRAIRPQSSPPAAVH